ncbi:MAG: hypothetical protein SPI12_01785 [Actinomycetaceae bacterium]|nr:hypothetical protein [Actinomycetaceae bacterium]MDY6082579.1 hypothetical protein [Actinomycetaceae bacterium]
MASINLFELDVAPEGASVPERVLEYVYPLINSKSERNTVMLAYYSGEPDASMWDAFWWLDMNNMKLPKELVDDVRSYVAHDPGLQEELEEYKSARA